jgi:hypothetical protein
MRNVAGFLLVGTALIASATGCKKNKGDKTTPENAGGDTSVSKVDATLCETAGKNVVTYDLNRDNKPDVWRLFKTEEEGGARIDVLTCKQVDFDHDGRKDWVVGYNRKGAVLYEKADFDYDGRFDMSSIYDQKTGKVIEVERDSDFDGKYDLKESYDSAGLLNSVRKDRDGNEKPDVWEQYRDGQLIAILYDDDGDEKVDRREEVPGARPKVEMPDMVGGSASGGIDDKTKQPAPAPGTTTPAPTPAPAPTKPK